MTPEAMVRAAWRSAGIALATLEPDASKSDELLAVTLAVQHVTVELCDAIDNWYRIRQALERN